MREDSTYRRENVSAAADDASSTSGVHLSRILQYDQDSLARFPEENPNPVIRVGRDGELLYANQPAVKFLEGCGCGQLSFLDGCMGKTLGEAIENDKPVTNEFTSNDRIFSMTFAPVLEKDYVNIYGLDVTERQRLENQLHEAKLRAERVDRAKSEFLANMSHELRTPLNGIIGFAEFMDGSVDINPEGEQCLKHIIECGNHLLELINDILDLARVESGQTKQEFKPFNLSSLVEKVANLIKPLMRRKRVELEIKVPERQLWLNGDETGIKEVLFNLLSNAIKFTTIGSKVGIDVTKTKAGIQLRIWDQGPGIPTDKASRIFEPFYRIDNEDETHQTTGTGLGLVISKSVVEAHGGDIRFESEINQGTTFIVDLPERLEITPAGNPQKSGADKKREITPPAYGSKRILVVEDNQASRLLLKTFLEKASHEVVLAKTGREALNALGGKPFDVVLLDINLPDIDGEEVLDECQRRLGDKAPPIVAETANAMKGDREKLLAVGFSDYLPKPIKKDNLFALLNALFEPHPNS